jgi:DnaJ-class molecular chaperone
MYQGMWNGPICHGCGGRGWVSPSYGMAAECPVCKGSGLGAIGHGTTVTIRLSDHSEPIGKR